MIEIHCWISVIYHIYRSIAHFRCRWPDEISTGAAFQFKIVQNTTSKFCALPKSIVKKSQVATSVDKHALGIYFIRPQLLQYFDYIEDLTVDKLLMNKKNRDRVKKTRHVLPCVVVRYVSSLQLYLVRSVNHTLQPIRATIARNFIYN